MGLNINPNGSPPPTATLDRAAAAPAASPDPQAAGFDAGRRTRHSDSLGPLLTEDSGPVHRTDFGHSASTVRPDAGKLGRGPLPLAGAASSAGSLQVPPAKAEEFARDALQSTLQCIDGIAGNFLGLREKLLASGTDRQLAEFEGALRKFLVQGEKTMVKLADDIVRRELAAPPSAALRKLMDFVTIRFWAGIREMQAELRGSIGHMFASTARPSATDPQPGPQLCRDASDRQCQAFQGEVDGMGVGRARHVAFNPRKLVEIAALLTQMHETRLHARPSAPDPQAGGEAAVAGAGGPVDRAAP